MSQLIFTPCCVSAISDENGAATLRIRIPGAFAGLQFDNTSPKSGRFFKSASLWTDNGTAGDRVSSLRLEDDNRILERIPDPENAGKTLSERFPEYPLILRFGDSAVELPAIAGAFLPTNGPLVIAGINDPELRFVPAGLSLVVDYVAAGGADKILRCNFYWGTFISL